MTGGVIVGAIISGLIGAACWAWYRAGFVRGIEILAREEMARRDAQRLEGLTDAEIAMRERHRQAR